MFYGYCKNKLETIDHWIETVDLDINNLKSSCTSHENFKNETLKRLEAFANKIEEIEKIFENYKENNISNGDLQQQITNMEDNYGIVIEDMDKKIKAIIECINGDRKDINCLIQMIKKIQINSTKRKNK